MIIRSLINLNLEAHDLQDDIAPIVEGGPTPRHPDPGIGTHTLAHPDGEPEAPRSASNATWTRAAPR